MDIYHLNRFVVAQESTYDQALKEIKAGRKMGHWMWFIFPQMKGLGTSYNSTFYGISSREEAEAYLKHPFLGPRLIEITSELSKHVYKSIENILGSIDSLKCQSCLKLFNSLPGADPVFDRALGIFFGHKKTKHLLIAWFFVFFL
jgi:uncharacterized protein (DUF1810 family)